MAAEPLPTTLLEQLCIEQGQRWRRGERVGAETYLRQHPALAAQADRAVELVYNEVLLREELGEVPQLGEYVGRFPQLATQLGRLFEVHGALEPASLLALRPTVLRRPTAWPTAVAAPRELPAVPGYEILTELGRGGMGVVYQARHLRLRRMVALKMMLSGGQAGPEELARFRAEAEAQAQLQHPNVVPIYEVGEAAGRPYLAMEFLAGGSLAQRLAGTPQPARPAAQLVQTLARAVQYAHQRGLIHRDLKPANVLLAEDGTPKITDFGLAKRLEGGAGPTRTGAVLGTPSYMAPEQARGHSGAITPATDVYALGAILYELLTGRPPFLAESPLETLAQVQLQEPVPPRRLRPKTPRDLETICLKCLHKEPRQRYAGAEALADDLGRFLADRPILARPVGWSGRLWRWCRRKPAVAILAAALLLGVAVGFPAITYLWLAATASAAKAEEQGRRAEQNLKEARQAVHKHFIVLSEIELSKEPGTHEVQKRLLEDALAYFQRFLQQRPDDPAMLADVAEAHARVGKITAMIGSKDDALAEYQQARGIYEQLVRDNLADGQLQSMLARTYDHIGLTERELGHRAEALRSHGQARALWEKLVQADPTASQLQSGLADAYHNIGLLEHDAGQRVEALRSYERARAIREDLAAANPADEKFQSDLAVSYNNIGVLQRQEGKHAESLRCHERARMIQEKLAAANPANAQYQRRLAGTYVNLGWVHLETGQHDEALRSYEEARALREQVVAANPGVAQYQSDLAQSYIYLGNLQGERRRPAEALGYYQQARAVQEKLVRANPGVTQYQAALAMSYNNIGDLQRKARQPDDALRSLEQAHSIQEKLVAANPTIPQLLSDLVLMSTNLAQLHQEAGRPAEALRCYEEARATQEKLVAANPSAPPVQFLLAQICWNLGNLQGDEKQWAEALHAFEQVYAVSEKLLSAEPDHFEYRSYACSAAHRRGEVLAELDRREEALAAFQQAIRHQRLLAAKAPQAAKYHYNVACELALCAALVGKGKAELAAQEEAERRRYADQAVDALRQAVAAGFKDLQQLQKDSDLDALRSRDDFKKLLGDVREKGKPGAK